MIFKAAIFDLDGVIVDTVPLHFKAWKKMFNEYGKEFDFEDYKEKVDGIPRFDGCRAILTDLPEEEIIKAGDKKQGYYMQYLNEDGVKVYVTTVSLIKELRTANIHTAVVSSSKNLRLILDKAGLLDLFEVKLSGNDITKGKPDPQIFLMAAEQLGVLPAESVVFEDAVLGIEGARRADMRCVGIDRNKMPELFKKADIVVNDLGEINLKDLQSLFPKL